MQMNINIHNISSSSANTFLFLSHTTLDTTVTSPLSVPSHALKDKWKQSVHDPDEDEFIMSSKLKHHSNTKSNTKSSVQESRLGPTMMTNVAGALNCLSDAMVMSVSATPQGVIQSVLQKIQQGHDKLMENEHMYLTKVVSDKASAYITQNKPKSHYCQII